MNNNYELTPYGVQKFLFLKNRLLDLGNQNRQIYFQPNHKDTIKIFHPQMSTLFKIVVELGQSCTFPSFIKKKKRQNKKTNQQNISSQEENSEVNEEIIPSEQFLKEMIEQNQSKFALTEIITFFDDDYLRSRLKTIQEKAQELEDEKGIDSLFLVFGILEWFDSVQKTHNSSPLLFIPIKLHCESPQTNYELEAVSEEIVVNPHLREKLRTSQRIDLPSFDEVIQMHSLRTFWEQVKDIIPKEWNLREESYISLFSGSKITLFNDIEAFPQKYSQHPIIRALMEDKGFSESPDKIPPEIWLTDQANPWDFFTIVDCDSSQMEAVLFAKAGSSLVIQGPPGTGKSQCISNIIAESLGDGKKILFIAEKKAAVEVVKNRLEKSGLGEFCMEIHAAAPKKAEIMNQFARTINLEYNPPPVRKQKHIELLLLRNRINEYVENINKPLGSAKYTIYEMMGRDLELSAIPLLNTSFPDPFSFSEEQLVKIEDQLSRLQIYQSTLMQYNNHPWSSADLPLNREGLKEYLHQHLHEFIIQNRIIESEIQKIVKKITPVHSKEEADDTAQNIDSDIENEKDLEIFNNMDKANYWKEVISLWKIWYQYQENLLLIQPIFHFQDPSQFFEPFDYIEQKLHINEQPENLNILIEKLEKYIQLVPQLKEKLNQFNDRTGLHTIKSKQDLLVYTEFLSDYNSNALVIDVGHYIKAFQEKYNMVFQRLGGSFHKDKALIMSCIRPNAQNRDIIDHLYRIQEFQKYFGKPKTSFEVEQFDFYLSQIQSMDFEIESLLEQLRFCFSVPRLNLDLTLRYGNSQQSIWKNNEEETKGWIAHLDQLNEWIAVQEIHQELKVNGLGDFFRSICNKQFQSITYKQLFQKIFNRQFLSKAIISHPQIENFHVEQHEQAIEQFKQLDEEILLLNRERLRQNLFALRPTNDNQVEQSLISQIGFLKREAKKKNKMKSLRDVFSYSRDFISILKPCLMMSPLSVANFLDLEKYDQYFDLVIFDEASQVTTEDALGAIVRGKQLIVVGDSQQLPPSQFFNTKSDDEFGTLELETETMESLLEECTGIGFREKLLRYHYRSRKEGLISFSNACFYDNRLFTFPDLEANSQGKSNTGQSAVEFHHLPNGIFENRKNPIEAEAVAQAILNHYETNQKNNTHYSLGVVAFSQSQQETILKELERLTRNNPEKEQLMRESSTEPLFIKNLENVQGDERDIMIISVGYGRNAAGSIGLHFGPINQAGGYRRLNVIITRARIQVKIFCSFLPSEINPQKVQAEGLRRLLDYLEFARSGTIPNNAKNTQTGGQKFDQQAPFINHIKQKLQEAGYTVVEQVGQSSFKIDLAIIHPQNPSQYLLGLICDGGAYALAPTTRDRDRIRPQVLAGLGWNIYHIWSPIWYSQSDKVLQEIKNQVAAAMQIISPSIIKKTPEPVYPAFTIKATSDNFEEKEMEQSNSEEEKDSASITPIISESTEGNDRTQYLSWTGVSQYQIFFPTHPISQGVFFAEDSTARIDEVKKILQIEGPMHIELFQKRIFQLFDFKRSSPRIIDKINDLYQVFIIDHDFIGLSTQTNPGIRICIDLADDPRSFSQIHPLEIQNTMILMLQKYERLKKADLFKFTLALFGISGVRKVFVARLEELLDHLINQHEVQNVGNYYTLKI